ncbi:MAG TPA: M56 family metallopeptidase [Vicinamibacterales bacterium]|nr:M56 family metallopeptidase [Vicinamibacterales bacterium]
MIAHLFESTLVAGAAWMLCRFVLASNHPRVRFAVWLTASIKFLIPFALIVEAGRSIGPRVVFAAPPPAAATELIAAGSGTAVALGPLSLSAPAAVTNANAFLGGPLVAIWALGTLCVLAAWLRGWLRVRLAARGATLAGRFRGVPVLESETMRRHGLEPGVIGLWRQAILLPKGLDESLTRDQLQSVLLHEWHHARRRDNLTAAMHMAVEAAFWFHPVVWWIGRRLIDERERACDRGVLDQSAAADYAEAILNVCKWYRPAPVPCVAGVTGADLRARIESVLRGRRPAPLGAGRTGLLSLGWSALVALPVLVGVQTAPPLYAQQGNSFLGLATDARKSFEVATIKPNNGEDPRWRLGPPGKGAITIVNLPLRTIIVQSFRTQRTMVSGGPSWIDEERFDIVGRGPDPTVSNPEVWEMMRSLLIERFKLKFHIEDREMAVYALTIGKNGHKLIPGEKGRCAEELKQGRLCGDILVPPFGTGMYNMPVGALFSGLVRGTGRPVVDRTGLTGRYDVNVSWMPADMTPQQLEEVPKEIRPPEMSVFEAVEQQAGLKLEPARAPMPVLVIDSVDHPTEN